MSPAADALRFDPPERPVPPAAAWALERGFGPIPLASKSAAVSSETKNWAVRLGVAERIAVRHDRALLATELGKAGADFLLSAARRATAQNLLLRELASEVTRVAEERGIRIFLLKGIALLEAMPDLAAARPMADVDVLVERGAARELSLALEPHGFTRSAIHESPQHLPALYHPQLGTLEIHTYLPGVGRRDRAGSPNLTASDLTQPALAQPAPELGPALLPARPILAAHAFAHAIVQSAHSPTGYPLLRLVADLGDLSTGQGTTDGLVAEAAPWLESSVSARELAAVSALCRTLEGGALPPPASDAGRILRHIVAGHLDPGYRDALKTRALAAAIRRGDWFKIRRRLSAAAGNGGTRDLPAVLGRLFRIGWARLSRRRGSAGSGS